jgi:hypothetical protein
MTVRILLTWAVARALKTRYGSTLFDGLTASGECSRGVWYQATPEAVRELYQRLMDARSYKSSLGGSTKHACRVIADQLCRR